MFAAEFFTPDKKPKCISAQFGKPLLSLPKHLKLTINMHDGTTKITPKPDLDIVNIPTNVKYTIVTAPTNSVYFSKDNYKDIEDAFFTKATLTNKAKQRLRTNLVQMHNRIVSGYDKKIAVKEHQAQLFFRLSNGIQSKNSAIVANHEKIVDIFARINEVLKPAKKLKIVVKGTAQKEASLETRLTNLYREFWQNEEFLESIKFTDLCKKKNISQLWDKNEIVAEIEYIQKNYELLKTRSGVAKIQDYVNLMKEIKDYDNESLKMDISQITDYTFKTVDNKQCIRDTLLTVCSGASKRDKEEFIYYFGFNAIPFYKDVEDQARFIEFFRDFVEAKKMTEDQDTESYVKVLQELHTSVDTSINTQYKLLIKLLMQDFTHTTSYAFNMEKRPDCMWGTLAYEYMKELMIMQSMATKNPNLMRLFYYFFALDHPGNRMQPDATVDELLNLQANSQANYDGFFYKSKTALPLRMKLNGKYRLDKNELMYLFCNLCENLDVLDNGCKNGDNLDICETGFFKTPESSPRSKEGSPRSKEGSPRSKEGSPKSKKSSSKGGGTRKRSFI
jgi:hypothetical protein